MSLIQTLKHNLVNIPGWRTNRKIVVFESDDWGSIRMPSKKALHSLTKKGIKLDNDDNWRVDCLESKEDIESLFVILSKYKDMKGNYPIFTFNTVMGNPDFDKIKKSNFNKFYHEFFFDSYKRYYKQDLKTVWKKGIEKGLIKPQFHAREHLNVSLWLKDLRNGIESTRTAFDHHFFGLVTETSSKNQKHYLAAYRAESPEELTKIKDITQQGLQLFENTFGFRSESFIPCNYILPKELESIVFTKGVNQIQAQRGQLQPNPFDGGSVKVQRRYTGQVNSVKQVFTIRNVKFEPFENKKKDWVDQALNEIKTAFFWKKPAIISTHRINFVGGIDIKHRDRNLKQLDLLIKRILKQWPEVEFMSSDALGRLIRNKKM